MRLPGSGALADQRRRRQTAQGGPVERFVHALIENRLPRWLRILKLWQISAMLIVKKAIVVPSALFAISPNAGLHEVTHEIARQSQQRHHYALVRYVRAHASGENARLRVARLAAHDVPLRLLHAQRKRREAVRHEVYPQEMHRLEYREAQKRRHKDADDLRHVRAQQELDGLADVVIDPAAFLHRAHDCGEVVVRQHHVCDVLRNVRTGDAHAHADVRALYARRVVDAVAGHPQ